MWQMGLKPKGFMCPVICFMDKILTVVQRCNKGWQKTQQFWKKLGLIGLSVSVKYLHYVMVKNGKFPQAYYMCMIGYLAH